MATSTKTIQHGNNEYIELSLSEANELITLLVSQLCGCGGGGAPGIWVVDEERKEKRLVFAVRRNIPSTEG